jgi:integrase
VGVLGFDRKRAHGAIHPEEGQHAKACKLGEVAAFVPYTFRHTCLTRWASILDPYTLAYLAGHSDFGTTRRYVHPNLNTAREALERARVAQSNNMPVRGLRAAS